LANLAIVLSRWTVHADQAGVVITPACIRAIHYYRGEE